MTYPGTAPMQPAPASFERAPEKRSAGPILAVLLLVAALVVGGGAYAAVRVLGGGGNQPADALPGNSLAYARVDLDPSARTKIAAFRLLDKAPAEVRDVLRSGDLREELFNMAKDSSPDLANLDFKKDIDPWLGDRVGFAAVPIDGSEEPVVAVAMQIKDKEKAEEGLRKLAAAEGDASDVDGLYYINGDYAVFSDTKEHVDSIKAATEAGTLAENATFKGDFDALGEEGVASGWADLAGMANRYPDSFAEAEQSMGVMGTMANPMAATPAEQMKQAGRLVGAMRVDAGYIEFVGLNRGSTVKDVPKGKNNGDISKLPADTVAAFSVGYEKDALPKYYETFRQQFPEDQRAELDQSMADGSAETGLKLPEDIFTLLGEGFTVGLGDTSFTNMEDPTQLPLGMVFKTDAGKADEIMGKLRTYAESQGEAWPLVTMGDGDRYYVALSQGHVDTLKAGGDLGSEDTFKEAVADAGNAQSVGYINLDLIEDEYLQYIDDQETRDAIASLKAIGFSAGLEGDSGDSRATLRITVN